MADLLTRVQRELDERMDELRPLVEEARQLELALAALGDEDAGAAQPTRRREPLLPRILPRPAPVPRREAPAEPAPSETEESQRGRITRDEAGERQRRVLAIITENPGTTAGNLALLLDTSVATMGSLLKRLEREGEIERAEKGYARRPQAASEGA
jgi:hypothetical protein